MPLDVVFAGNSVVREGVDAGVFSEECRRLGKPQNSLNIALGGTTELEHLLLVRETLDRHPEIRCVIYGFFDFHLTHPQAARWCTAEGNTAMDFYVHSDVGEIFLTRGEWWDRWGFRVIRFIPMFVERMTLWSRVEKIRRNMTEWGLPKRPATPLGRVDDFASLTSSSIDDFASTASERVRRQTPLSPALKSLFQLCRTRGVQVTVVEMPMTKAHRDRFYSLAEWQDYHGYIEGLIREVSARFVRATDWVDDPNLFGDAVHLTSEGARETSVRLAQEIVASESVLR